MSETSEYEDALPLAEAGGSWDPRQPDYHGPDHDYIAPGRRVANLPEFECRAFRRSALPAARTLCGCSTASCCSAAAVG